MEEDATSHPNPPIVFYDGACNLCNSLVRFVIRNDPGDRYRFAPLQSDVAEALVRPFGKDPKDLDTLLLIENNRLYQTSTAALKILASLKTPWRVLRYLMILPRGLRDSAYYLVARTRNRLFGRRQTTEPDIPEGQRYRFLD